MRWGQDWGRSSWLSRSRLLGSQLDHGVSERVTLAGLFCRCLRIVPFIKTLTLF
jgi:hypothetical protein